MSQLEQTLRITGMDCAECATTLERGVQRLAGVQACEVNFAASKMRVVANIDIDETAIHQRIRELGYDVDTTPIKIAAVPEQSRREGIVGFGLFLLERHTTTAALIGCIILVLGFIAHLLNVPSVLRDGLLLASILIAGFPIARSGLRAALINRTININLLMTIAAMGAVFIGELGEGALTLCLFAIGEALQGYTTDKARRSIQSLMQLTPSTAIRLQACMDCREHLGHAGYTGGPCPWCGVHEQSVTLDQLAVGDTILVKAGERIPMDGRVSQGESSVNQAPITGESMPVTKQVGHDVYAGSVNGEGTLEITVMRLVQDSTLNRIIHMVEEAQASKAPAQTRVDQFAKIYTPAVVFVAAALAILPPLLFNAPFYDQGNQHGWLYRALSLLVIACPCALVISTPVSIISAITNAARHGVLIKGGAILEALGKVRVFAFDKTGTLTRGQPTVQQVVTPTCAGQHPLQHSMTCPACDDLLALAASVERRATHPLAQAVVDAAQQRGVAEKLPAAAEVFTLTGRGVQGKVNGQAVTVGSHRYFEDTYPHQSSLCDAVQEAESHGYTAMLLHDGSQVRGFITVSDTARQSSKDALAELHTLPHVDQVVMLTGDSTATAQRIAQDLGIDSVRANLLPEDKLAAIRTLLASEQHVAMVGDGINDTPALAAASVGIAMGGAGTDQALETADVVLMADDLGQLPHTVALSQHTQRIISQNIAFSLGIKAFFLILALFGVASLWLAVFADMGTSLLVTFNGMRLLNYQYKGQGSHPTKASTS